MKKLFATVITSFVALFLGSSVCATEVNFDEILMLAGPDIELADYYGSHEYVDESVQITVNIDKSGFTAQYEFPNGVIMEDSGSLRKIEGGLYQLMGVTIQRIRKTPIDFLEANPFEDDAFRYRFYADMEANYDSYQGDWKAIADFFMNEIHHIGEEYFTVKLNLRDMRTIRRQYGNFYPPEEMLEPYLDYMWGLEYLDDDFEESDYKALLVSFHEDRIEMYDADKTYKSYYLGTVYLAP